MSTGKRAGVGRIRTHTNRRMTEQHRPHELYMRLTSLEIERTRRIAEREMTQSRLLVVNDRIAEIEQERDSLLARLDTLSQHDHTESASGPPRTQPAPFNY